jgi:hypothetical protein
LEAWSARSTVGQCDGKPEFVAVGGLTAEVGRLQDTGAALMIVMSTHELAEVLLILNGIRAGRRRLLPTRLASGPTGHRDPT